MRDTVISDIRNVIKRGKGQSGKVSILRIGLVVWLLWLLLLFVYTSRQKTIEVPLLSPRPVLAAEQSSFLENEAGITAYTEFPTTINFFYVRDLFRTIELETSEYIIGSIPLSGYLESDDVHTYIHESGWVVAYYLQTEPTSKIFDWQTYGNGWQTRLEIVIENVALALQMPTPEIGYYHFGYPEATHLMLVADTSTGGNDTFEVNLPNDFTYYEGSWSLGGYPYYYDTVSLKWDGTQLGSSYHTHCCLHKWVQTIQGFLSNSQLAPDVFHTVIVRMDGSGTAYGGLALVYQED